MINASLAKQMFCAKVDLTNALEAKYADLFRDLLVKIKSACGDFSQLNEYIGFDNDADFQQFIEYMHKLGYHVEWKVINPISHYYSVIISWI